MAKPFKRDRYDNDRAKTVDMEKIKELRKTVRSLKGNDKICLKPNCAINLNLSFPPKEQTSKNHF